jgi:hypothetical protein
MLLYRNAQPYLTDSAPAREVRVECVRAEERNQKCDQPAPSVERAGRGLIAASVPQATRSGHRGFAVHVTARQRKRFRLGRHSLTPVPARPCGGCERDSRNQPGAVLWNDATLTGAPAPGSGRQLFRSAGAAVSSGVGRAVGSFAKSDHSARRLAVTEREVRDRFSGAAVGTYRVEFGGSFRVPRVGSRQTDWGERYLLRTPCQRGSQ